MSKKPYDVLIAEEYEHKGEKRTKFYNVGVMFENDREGWTLNIPEGISISGRVVILPRKEKAQSDTRSGATSHNTDPEAGDHGEIPY